MESRCSIATATIQQSFAGMRRPRFLSETQGPALQAILGLDDLERVVDLGLDPGGFLAEPAQCPEVPHPAGSRRGRWHGATREATHQPTRLAPEAIVI